MTEFSTTASLYVQLDDSSLNDARDQLEEELTADPIQVEVEPVERPGSAMEGISGGGGFGGASGQGGALNEITDSWEENISLNETRNDLLQELVDAQELTARSGGGGNLLRSLGGIGGVLAAGLAAGGAALVQKISSALGDFSWPSLPDVPPLEVPNIPPLEVPTIPPLEIPDIPPLKVPDIPEPDWIWPPIPVPDWLEDGSSTNTGEGTGSTDSSPTRDPSGTGSGDGGFWEDVGEGLTVGGVVGGAGFGISQLSKGLGGTLGKGGGSILSRFGGLIATQDGPIGKALTARPELRTGEGSPSILYEEGREERIGPIIKAYNNFSDTVRNTDTSTVSTGSERGGGDTSVRNPDIERNSSGEVSIRQTFTLEGVTEQELERRLDDAKQDALDELVRKLERGGPP